MNNFTSDELKIIDSALEFYKYEMNKTDDMDKYRAWKSAMKKFNDSVLIYRGVRLWEDTNMRRDVND